MGCDIHLFAEKKVNGKWVTLDKWVNNPDYPHDDNRELIIETEFGGEYNGFYSYGRNYNLFAALCGVRSSHFNNPPKPIRRPRGIPKDCCEETRRERIIWSEDAHSDSFLTLSELIRYDWTTWGGTCDYFIKEIIPKMLLQSHNPNEIRIVFWFDN